MSVQADANLRDVTMHTEKVEVDVFLSDNPPLLAYLLSFPESKQACYGSVVGENEGGMGVLVTGAARSDVTRRYCF